MKKHIYLILSFTLLLLGSNLQAQPLGGQITWEDLAQIEWKNYYDELLAIDVQEPVFDSSILMMDGNTITISGFIIPVDTDDNTMIISAFPFSNCFFCGGAGPETVMQLDLKRDRSLINKKVTITGRLKLNKSDFLKLIYEMKGVEVLSVE